MAREAPLFVSFYTNETYRRYAVTLERSLDQFGLDHEIVPLRETGSWEMNTRQKAPFLLGMLDRYERDLVWVDADAVVKEYPELLAKGINEDVAIHYYEGRQPVSGTLYVSNRITAKTFLERWSEVNRNYKKFDDLNIPMALERTQGVSGLQLPVEYCWLEDLMRPQKPEAKPVIVHFRESVRSGKVQQQYKEKPSDGNRKTPS